MSRRPGSFDREVLMESRTINLWSDWMLRHAPEVLLAEAGLGDLSTWYATRPVFMAPASARYWTAQLPFLRQSLQAVEHQAMRLHRACSPVEQARAVSDAKAMGAFASAGYRLGSKLLGPELHRLSWEISTHAALAWWAASGWDEPKEYREVLSRLNEPLRSIGLAVGSQSSHVSRVER